MCVPVLGNLFMGIYIFIEFHSACNCKVNGPFLWLRIYFSPVEKSMRITRNQAYQDNDVYVELT